MTSDDALIEQSARAIGEATSLVVTAGAGMGVDSGLPDFRGTDGFWAAYPPYRALGLRFEELANPRWFDSDPALAWGFYGHRLALYRRTVPHEGFAILRRWGERKTDGAFAFTSNVDGQFQRSKWDPARVVECHGAIDTLQCTRACGSATFPADDVSIEVDPETFRAVSALPTCPVCGALARPNILMFDDWGWDGSRTSDQQDRLRAWLERAAQRDAARVVVIELGAGRAVPTVRAFGERLVASLGAHLVRVNPRESDVPRGQIGLSRGALDALRAIDGLIGP
jgi:NAD-dependent SIR2 family protein deacetylase